MNEFLFLIPLGLLAGLYGTFIGAGGGFVIMPILLFLYPDQPPAALTAISLAVILCNSAVGSFAYARQKRIDYKSGLILAAATIPGAILGAGTTHLLPHGLFDELLGGLLILIGLFLASRPESVSSNINRGWHGPAQTGHEEKPVELSNPSPLGEGGPQGPGEGLRSVTSSSRAPSLLGTYNLKLGVSLSLVVGYLSSILGIGGGVIHVPVMTRLLRFPVHIATATSHFILIFMACAGVCTHLAAGNYAGHWPRVLALACGIVPGALLGAALSQRVHGKWVMRALALALLAVGARVIFLAFQNHH